jgi:hypothetical protein
MHLRRKGMAGLFGSDDLLHGFLDRVESLEFKAEAEQAREEAALCSTRDGRARAAHPMMGTKPLRHRHFRLDQDRLLRIPWARGSAPSVRRVTPSGTVRP